VTAEPPLDEKVVLLERTLRSARLPHAFGGAIALAYYAEPRATVDLDVNVFVPPSKADRVLERLGRLGVSGKATNVIERGQVRLWWGRNPVDVFFAYDAFHHMCGARTRKVPFAGMTIPILSAEDLTVLKAIFDRRKDWIDIEQMMFAGAGAFDVAYVRDWLVRLVGKRDGRITRFDEAVGRVLG
jgi:hypothetical protein